MGAIHLSRLKPDHGTGPRRLQLVLWLAVLLAVGCRSSHNTGQRETAPPASSPMPSPAAVDTPANETTLPRLSANSTLRDYLAYAALSNPGLEAAFLQWKAALERNAQVRALPDPKFTYGNFIQEVETRVGPQNHRFALSQSFPWFGTLELRGALASDEARAAFERFEAARLAVFNDVKQAYYELYYLYKAIGITVDNIRLLKDLERVAQTKVSGGQDLMAVTKAQAELGRLEDRRRTLEALKTPLAGKLNAALNRPQNAEVPWPTEVVLEPVDVSHDALVAWMAEQNPELQELDHLIRREDRAVELAKKKFFPDLTLGVDYIETGSAIAPGVPDDGKDPVIASVSINLPLWYGKNRAALAEARQKRDSMRQRRVNRENRLQADLEMALYRFRDAERKINLYGKTLTPLATQALNVTRQSWEAGRADFLDLIDSERILLEFQLAYERSLADLHQRLAEIEQLVGRDLSGWLPPDKNSETTNEELQP